MTRQGISHPVGFKPDYWLLLALTLLLTIGIAMVYSSSFYVAQIMGRSYGSFYYFKRHVILLTAGLIGLSFFTFLPVWSYRTLSRILMVIAIVGLVIVLFKGYEIRGARRWLSAPVGGFRFQPSELAKFALVLFLAHLMDQKGGKMRKFRDGVLPGLLWTGLVSGLILLQPNVSTATLVFVLGGLMLFLGGMRLAHGLLIGGSLVLLAGIGIWMVTSSPWAKQGPLAKKFQHVARRIELYKDPQKNYQVTQARIGIAEGGLLGTGIGKGKVKFRYLPFSHTDFVLAIIGEELGLAGILVVVFLFLIIGWRGYDTAVRLLVLRKTPMLGYMAAGITTLILLSAWLHMAVVLGLIPPTGLPLPFISYGGSNLITSLAGMGLLLRLSHIARTGDETL